MEEAIARNIKLATSELPPKETNGNVTPTTGRKPIFIPIFTKNWMRKKRKQQTRKVFSNILSLLKKMV
jgi:hypothetical protein